MAFTNAVLILIYSLCRWPTIETELGDRVRVCWGTAVFAVVLPHCYAGDAFVPQPQKGHFPDNTIHWPNAVVMLGHRLRR